MCLIVSRAKLEFRGSAGNMRKICYIAIPCVILIGRVGLESYLQFSRSGSDLVPGKRIRITERIPETPRQSESTQTFKIKGITVVAPRYPAYSYGQQLQIEGEIKRSVSSSAGSLLRRGNDDLVLIYPNILVLAENEQNGFPQGKGFIRLGGLVVNMRKGLVGLFRKLLSEPHASLLAGIVVGERANMPPAFHEALKATGTMHIIAVSGMNISIVGGVLVELLVRFLSRRKAVVAAVIGIWFYAILAGLSAPVVRAAIMGNIAFLALILGRERDAKRALLITAGLMILWDLNYLVDIGWQLSFAATAGILWWQPVLKMYLRIDELAVTLAAYAATMPLLVYHFGQLSWISPLPNLLIAPVVVVVTIGGGVVAILGWVPFLGKLTAWMIWPFLEYMVRVISWFGRFEAMNVSQMPIWGLAASYGLLLCLFWQLGKMSDRQTNGTK